MPNRKAGQGRCENARTDPIHETGFITRREYEGTPGGRLSRLIRDVDTAFYDDVPEGWQTPAGGGLNLVSDYDYDLLGRQIQELGPVHEIDDGGTARLVRSATWTAYQDLARQTASARGIVWGEGEFLSHRRIGPVDIRRLDLAGRLTDRIRAVPEHDDRPASGDEYPQHTWTAWTRHSYGPILLGFPAYDIYRNAGLEVWRRDYHDIPASGAGLAGKNFDQTDFGYDPMLRRNRSVSPGGTVTWQVHDVRGNVVETWIGTNATGGDDSDPSNDHQDGNNMNLVRADTYDGGTDKGNNLLTKITLHVDDSTVRETTYGYDWRDRQTSSLGPLGDYRSHTWDNRGNILVRERRNGGSGGTLLARSEDSYDSRNRLFRELTRGVTSGGAQSGSIATDLWRDEAGNVIKRRAAGSRAWTKTVYDGIGRAVSEYLCYRTTDDGATNSVADNIVIEQTENVWDAASNLIERRVLARFDNAGSTTGALVPPGAGTPQGRRSTTCFWADGIGRAIATAEYGTHAGLPVERPALIPASGDTVPVILTAYDPSGRPALLTNPLGLQTLTRYDARDRVIRSVENAGAEDPAAMQITEQSWSPDGSLEILTLKNADTGDQVTRWLYGTTLEDSGIATSNLLRAKIYPDNPLSLDPQSPGGLDRVSYAYNIQGEPIVVTDQTGTVREIDYDDRGRPVNDRVTGLGDGVDGWVQCISTAWDGLDRRTSVTSWPGSSPGGTPVNQVAFTYNNFSRITADRQQHEGAVHGGTPQVAYTYDNGVNNLIRPTSITYPDGRWLQWQYNGNDANFLPRINRIHDAYQNLTLADYAFLGASQIVTAAYPEPGVSLVRHAQGSGNVPSDNGPHDPYVGLDRFGRDIDHRWVKGGANLERIQYGYDAASRRTWRREAVATAGGQDEAYRYDGLSQITGRRRGTLNLSATAIGTEVAGETFDYDPTGNWNRYLAWSGEGQIDQSRTYNEANEMKTLDGLSSWLAYDPAGRMTRVPAGETPADGYYHLVWDAWSRLVRVNLMSPEGILVADTWHQYDGLFRRIRSGSILAPEEIRDFYYDLNWKIVEERVKPGGGDYTDQYVYGVRGRNDTILRDRWDDHGSSSSGSGSSGGVAERLYALCDAMGSKTAIVSDAGAVLERYGYSAFGMSRVMAPDFSPRETTHYDWQVRFHGETRDADTGWYNYGFRYYLPELGKWPSRDPIEEESGWNLYGFIGNDAVNWMDNLGAEKSNAFDTIEEATHDGGINDDKKSLELLKKQQDAFDALPPAQRVGKTRPNTAVEFCGRVCKNCSYDESGKKKNTYYWTGFSQGTHSSCNPTGAPECAESDEFVGVHHNHPKSPGGFKSGGLSERDKETAKRGRNWKGLPKSQVIPAGVAVGATYHDGTEYKTDFHNPNKH